MYEILVTRYETAYVYVDAESEFEAVDMARDCSRSLSGDLDHLFSYDYQRDLDFGYDFECVGHDVEPPEFSAVINEDGELEW